MESDEVRLRPDIGEVHELDTELRSGGFGERRVESNDFHAAIAVRRAGRGDETSKIQRLEDEKINACVRYVSTATSTSGGFEEDLLDSQTDDARLKPSRRQRW